MNIAVLAWGSLVWDRRNLAVAGDFASTGPRLPIEFCRVSNDGRLTLVLDDDVGASCLTYAVRSSFDDLDRALANLWLREGKTDEKLPKDVRASGRVGYVDVASGKRSDTAAQRHPKAVDAISAWSQTNGFEGVIWTALAGNFREPDKAGEPFSVDAAIRHLEKLEPAKREEALRYIRSAPAEVQTPVRAAVIKRWPE